MVFTPNEDPMKIDKTQFKPFIKQEKQRQHVNNICLYCGKLSHTFGACPNKCVQHAPCTTTSTIVQGLEEKGNKDVQFQ
jgi:hypothetical protein